MLASACPGRQVIGYIDLAKLCSIVSKAPGMHISIVFSSLFCFIIGWVCYAEKTHGSFILPYISSTKSPQQIMGSLVKQHLAQSLGKRYTELHIDSVACERLRVSVALTACRPDQIYHVTVMPCFDKKLEASRSDFYNDIYRTRDVDCVITSGWPLLPPAP